MLCLHFAKAMLKHFTRSQTTCSNASIDWQRHLVEPSTACALLCQYEVRINLFSDVRLKPTLRSQDRGKSDHGRIVRAQPRFGIFKFKSFACTCFAQLFGQFLIATNPAAD